MTRALLEQALSLSGYYESTWVGDLGDLEKLVQAAIEAIRAELAKPQSEPESFDVWRENPYTIALGKSVEEDYHPAHTEKDVTLILDAFDNIELRRDLAREIRRILGVPA